jgi:acyl carrier protein
MPKANEKQVLEIIQRALFLEDKKVSLDTSVEDLEEWDSVGHLSILSNMDKFFDGKIAPIREMATADSVRKILKILKENSLI